MAATVGLIKLKAKFTPGRFLLPPPRDQKLRTCPFLGCGQQEPLRIELVTECALTTARVSFGTLNPPNLQSSRLDLVITGAGGCSVSVSFTAACRSWRPGMSESSSSLFLHESPYGA
ncbi:hypothetical protein OIU77_028522 [Salix suchowensis]|uniref:Uncharacterized protein n=1 Tax=Salix suchowensis TaxID=1278906 RepID=A0ABQ9BLK1_9ROSI|nr:hypothetical protein OIU78_008204 [Salix suchowensis]KAJ6385362.1 hypothetical protein OIU77_028522 [Salix suchowensis]